MKDLNLIPKSYIADKKNKVKKTYFSIIILIAGFVFALGYIVPTIYQMSLAKNRDTLQAQVNETTNFVNIQNKFASLKAAVQQREDTGKQLAAYNNDVLAVINVLERACPEFVAFTTMTTTAENNTVKISLKGYANTEFTIASFIRNLSNEDYFNTIDLTSVVKNQSQNGFVFNIDVTGIAESSFSVYNNIKNNFSIKYPKEWDVAKEEDNNILFVSKNITVNSSPGSIEVVISKENSSLDDCVKSRINKLKESKVFEDIYSHKTKLRGTDAFVNMYYITEAGVKYQVKEICVVKANKLFIVTCKENSLEFSNYSKTIDRILNSLYIK